jgi:hypothetical protein
MNTGEGFDEDLGSLVVGKVQPGFGSEHHGLPEAARPLAALLGIGAAVGSEEHRLPLGALAIDLPNDGVVVTHDAVEGGLQLLTAVEDGLLLTSEPFCGCRP